MISDNKKMGDNHLITTQFQDIVNLLVIFNSDSF